MVETFRSPEDHQDNEDDHDDGNHGPVATSNAQSASWPLAVMSIPAVAMPPITTLLHSRPITNPNTVPKNVTIVLRTLATEVFVPRP